MGKILDFQAAFKKKQTREMHHGTFEMPAVPKYMMNHLQKHNVACSACGSKEWAIGANLVYLPICDEELEYELKASFIICHKCGHMGLFETDLVGIVEEE